MIRQIKLCGHCDGNTWRDFAKSLPLKSFRKQLFTALILGLALNALNCRCQQLLPAWRTNLQAYLTNRPWVSEIELGLSLNHYSINGKLLEGMETFRGSLQPGGFFLQTTTNLPYNRLLTTGESTNDYWQVTLSGIGYAPKDPTQGGSISNTISTICSWQKERLLDALNLGIESLDTDTIRWISPTQFIANSSLNVGGFEVGKVGEIRGQIEAFDQGLPSRLSYSNSIITNEERIILYHYDEPSLPPSETTIQVWKDKKKTATLWNSIYDIRFGLRDESNSGFLPSQFLAKNYVPKITLIQSNGLRYAIEPNGHLRLFEPTKEQLANFNGAPLHPGVSPWILIVTAAGVLAITFIILARIRRRAG
jgi:hypothetical protein